MAARDVPIWILSVRKTGHLNQCRALIAALGRRADRELTVEGKAAADLPRRKAVLRVMTPLQILGLVLTSRLPKPLILVTSGRSVLRLARIWRWMHRGHLFIIHVGVTRAPTDFVDILVASRHQLSAGRPRPEAARIISVDGVLAAPISASARAVDQTRRPALLVGGKNITFDYDGPAFRASLNALRDQFQQTGCDIALSRRTYPRTQTLLREVLSGPQWRFIAASDRAGFERVMGAASLFVVCPDSITMVSECCSTGRTTWIPEMDRLVVDSENARFIDHFMAEGYAASFGDRKPTRKLLDQATRIAPQMAEAIEEWHATRR